MPCSIWLFGHSSLALCLPLLLCSMVVSSDALAWLRTFMLLQLLPEHAVEGLAKQLHLAGKCNIVCGRQAVLSVKHRVRRLCTSKIGAKNNTWAD